MSDIAWVALLLIACTAVLVALCVHGLRTGLDRLSAALIGGFAAISGLMAFGAVTQCA